MSTVIITTSILMALEKKHPENLTKGKIGEGPMTPWWLSTCGAICV